MRAKVVTMMRWYAQDEMNQEDSEQNEVDGMKKGADSTGKVMHMWKSGWWFVRMFSERLIQKLVVLLFCNLSLMHRKQYYVQGGPN